MPYTAVYHENNMKGDTMEKKQAKEAGSPSGASKKDYKKPRSWNTDTIIVNGSPFTILFPPSS